MMSAKMATQGLLKITTFWSKGNDVIIPVDDANNKILSRDSNYIVDIIKKKQICKQNISFTTNGDWKNHSPANCVSRATQTRWMEIRLKENTYERLMKNMFEVITKLEKSDKNRDSLSAVHFRKTLSHIGLWFKFSRFFFLSS